MASTTRQKKKYHFWFDHIAIPIDPAEELASYIRLFELLGFKTGYYRPHIGNEETAMETVVMWGGPKKTSRGSAQFALMRGLNGRDSRGKRIVSQVNEYYHRFGFFPQHIALRCNDIVAVVDDWTAKGVRFLTEDEQHRARILTDDEEGVKILQCFTYPFRGTWFFEIKQVLGKGSQSALNKYEEFRDANVKGLWASLDRALKEGWLFQSDIFGPAAPSAAFYTYPQLAAMIRKLLHEDDSVKVLNLQNIFDHWLRVTWQQMVSSNEARVTTDLNLVLTQNYTQRAHQ